MRRLTALELLVMHYVDNKSKGTVLNQNFWTDIYSTNPMKILKKLIDDRVIIEKTDYNLTLSKLKNPDLKEILKDNGLKVTGNKSELVNRIVENNVDLSGMYLPSIYSINDDYKEVFDETSFLIEFAYGYDVTLDDAYQYYLSHPGKDELEILTGIYIDKLQSLMKSNNERAIYSIRSVSDNIARYYFKHHEIDKGFYYFNLANVINTILSFNHFLQYHEYGDVNLRANIPQNDLIKYRTALSNNQFTIMQLENNLYNAAKPLNYNNSLKDSAIKFMIAYIQDEFIDPHIFIKDILKTKNNKSNNNNYLKLEVDLDDNTMNYPMKQTDEPKTKKKKRFWFF